MKLVSVIMPCYNQGGFLRDALDSLLAQRYKHWECLIIDDGSTDDTQKIAQTYIQRDGRFCYLFKENGGLSSARNAGLDSANGKYIQFLDADDALHPNKLQASVEWFDKRPESCVVFTDFYECHEEINHPYLPWCSLYDKKFSYESVLLDWDSAYTIPIHCALLQIEVMRNFRFREEVSVKEDWLMWLQLFRRPLRYVFIKERYAYYRQHAYGMSKSLAVLYSGTAKTFNYIVENENLGPLLEPFFLKVNGYWNSLLVKHFESKTYQWGQKATSGFDSVKRIAKSIMHKKT